MASSQIHMAEFEGSTFLNDNQHAFAAIPVENQKNWYRAYTDQEMWTLALGSNVMETILHLLWD